MKNLIEYISEGKDEKFFNSIKSILDKHPISDKNIHHEIVKKYNEE